MKSGNTMRKRPQKALLAGAAALALLVGTGAASAQNERANAGASAGGSAQVQGSHQTGASGQLQGQAGASGRVNGQAAGGAQGGFQSNNSAQSEQRSLGTQGRNEAGSRYGRNDMRNGNNDMRGGNSDMRSGNNEYSSRGTSRRSQSEAARTEMQSRGATNDRDLRGRGSERQDRMSSGRDERYGRMSSEREGRARFDGRGSFDRSVEVQRGGEYGDFRGNTSERSYGGNIRLSAEQRSRIRERVIDARNAPRIGHLGFDLRVGAAIPRGDIRVLPLPYTLVQLEPRWRGYAYFVYEDEIVVVDPSDMTIVSIIEA